MTTLALIAAGVVAEWRLGRRSPLWRVPMREQGRLLRVIFDTPGARLVRS